MIRNFTPHPINILDVENNTTRTIESAGQIRLSMDTEIIGDIDGITTTRTIFGDPEGLPEQVDGTWLIVSQLVKSAVGRGDMLVPADVVRNSQGQIIGCRSLGQ